MPTGDMWGPGVPGPAIRRARRGWWWWTWHTAVTVVTVWGLLVIGLAVALVIQSAVAGRNMPAMPARARGVVNGRTWHRELRGCLRYLASGHGPRLPSCGQGPAAPGG